MEAHYAQFEGQFEEDIVGDDMFFDESGRRSCVENTTMFRILVDLETWEDVGRR